MDDQSLKDRLHAAGEAIKAKGWESAHISINVSYLAMSDREQSSLDPMMHFSPSIRASSRDKYRAPTSHEFVKGATYDCKTMKQAVAILEKTVDAMPTMEDEIARIESAKSKLSDDERRLLGIR